MSDAAAIRVGNVTVGQVVVQENGVRGEGGPFDPRLMLPLTATMHPRPQAEAITLLDVTGSLHFTPQGQQEPFDENQVGPAVTVRLARQQMLVRSFPDNPVDSQFQLRIPLTQALVALLGERQGVPRVPASVTHCGLAARDRQHHWSDGQAERS